MKIKINLIILSLVVLATGVTAGNQPKMPLTVTVYDFAGDAETASYRGKVTALVTADLTTETNLVMLERAELDKALGELAFGFSGMVNSDAAAKIGQITGAKVLVAGLVMKTSDNHLVIVANIIGTETGRLFADKVEGASDNLMDLTSQLSRKIAQTITAQASNLVMPPEESYADRLERIIKNISGTNRPSVSVNITQLNRSGHRWQDNPSEHEFGTLLLKAGFKVMDGNPDQKPDIDISGDATTTWGEAPIQRGGLLTIQATIALKIVDRRTGTILAFERQESSATGIGEVVLDTKSQVNAIDALAERILPLLAK
jgi:TolB-like protein